MEQRSLLTGAFFFSNRGEKMFGTDTKSSTKFKYLTTYEEYAHLTQSIVCG